MHQCQLTADAFIDLGLGACRLYGRNLCRRIVVERGRTGVEQESNGGRVAVESGSNRICNKAVEVGFLKG